MANFRSGSLNKKNKNNFSKDGHIIYHLKAPFMLIYNLVRTKVLKSTFKKLLVIVSLFVQCQTFKTKIEKKRNQHLTQNRTEHPTRNCLNIT